MTARIPTPEERRELAELAWIYNDPESCIPVEDVSSADRMGIAVRLAQAFPSVLRALDIAEAALERAGCQYIGHPMAYEPACSDSGSPRPRADWCFVCVALAQLRGGPETCDEDGGD